MVPVTILLMFLCSGGVQTAGQSIWHLPAENPEEDDQGGRSLLPAENMLYEFCPCVWQDWAAVQAGHARQMTMHALDLTNRSQGSRCHLGVGWVHFQCQ